MERKGFVSAAFVANDFSYRYRQTPSRAGAVASFMRGSFYNGGDQRMRHFDEGR
jgi:hypothetical protein